MPTMAATRQWVGRWGFEMFLALLASAMFLGFLGTVDLWGKREQRASAEAIDTIDQEHWLVARIQGRPRLEKPPLPRWTIATLMRLTGRRDEWMVRLPSALAALGTVALVYGLGCRLGGRSVGLTSGLALTSLGFFIIELRQAGNDGPLAFFTTLALYAAWRRLHGEPTESDPAPPGARRWNLVFYSALGLGFLTKGPIIVVLVAVTLLPYLATARRFLAGSRLLADGWGLLVFVLLALSWPVPVLLNDSNAARVWYLEMAQKAGTAGIHHHNYHELLVVDWPWMTIPWVFFATTAVILPFLPRGRSYRPRIWFPWWWAVGNMAMFCLWSVAKPNYYLPCLPGVALLIGMEWVRITRRARESQSTMVVARKVLQLHWVVLFAGALIAPVVVRQAVPQWWVWSVVLGLGLASSVVASAYAWRRGADAGALAPLAGALTLGVLAGYGAIVPTSDSEHSHRDLAVALNRLLPPEARTVMFFHELDEGLWFYLRDRTLLPVPGSQPRYNEGFDLDEDYRHDRLELDPNKRMDKEKQLLLAWLRRPGRESQYVLIRNKVYDLFAPDLAGLVTPVHREQGLKRNELVLLRVNAPAGPVASGTNRPGSARR